MILYHGTIDKYADSIMNNGILLKKSKPHLDFGPGFYTTSDKEFAISTAKWRMRRYNAFHKNDPVKWRVVELECYEDRIPLLRIKTFEKADDLWAKFILANRSMNPKIKSAFDNNIYACYDVVSGPTADGKNGDLTQIVEALDSDKIRIEEIDYSLFAPSANSSWGHQISFHTEKSLSCIVPRRVI